MSVLPPKADIGTHSRDVCLVPKADIASVNHLVGALLQEQRHVQPKSFRSFKIDRHHESLEGMSALPPKADIALITSGSTSGSARNALSCQNYPSASRDR